MLVEALVVLALALVTLPVWVLVRHPSFWVQLHVPGLLHGLLLLLAAAMLAGGVEAVSRGALIALFLLLTTPISNHALARVHAAEERDGPLPGREERASPEP